jgi:hypothetical protein
VAWQLHRAPTAYDRGGYTARWAAIGATAGRLRDLSDVAVSWHSTTDTTRDVRYTSPALEILTVRAGLPLLIAQCIQSLCTVECRCGAALARRVHVNFQFELRSVSRWYTALQSPALLL